MGVFAYTRKTFSNVLDDVRTSYYTHRLNAQALWSIDNSFFPSLEDMQREQGSQANVSKLVKDGLNFKPSQSISISSLNIQQNSNNNNYENIAKNEITFTTLKFWLESIKETIFAYTLPIFHIIKLPIFLTVAAFSEVFNGLKSGFNFFFKRNKNNAQGNEYESDDFPEYRDYSVESETKDYSVNACIEDYFKPQLITVDFSRVNNTRWEEIIDFARGHDVGLVGLDMDDLKKKTYEKISKI